MFSPHDEGWGYIILAAKLYNARMLFNQSKASRQLNLWDIDLVVEGFYRWGPLMLFPSSSFLAVFSLVLHSASISVNAGSTRRYLDSTEVSQVVQLLQEGTAIHATARRFAVSPTVSNALILSVDLILRTIQMKVSKDKIIKMIIFELLFNRCVVKRGPKYRAG